MTHMNGNLIHLFNTLNHIFNFKRNLEKNWNKKNWLIMRSLIVKWISVWCVNNITAHLNWSVVWKTCQTKFHGIHTRHDISLNHIFFTIFEFRNFYIWINFFTKNVDYDQKKAGAIKVTTKKLFFSCSSLIYRTFLFNPEKSPKWNFMCIGVNSFTYSN